MLKNINWKVRLKNPTFWIQLVIALVSPILVGLGVQWQDMTTWAALWDALCNAVSNPVIVVSVIGSVWACITDPTTKGTADSRLALSYTTPKEDRPADRAVHSFSSIKIRTPQPHDQRSCGVLWWTLTSHKTGDRQGYILIKCLFKVVPNC